MDGKYGSESRYAKTVLGLGTRAVDRTSGDYPKIISLDRPQAQIWPTVAARHRYSQHQVDVLDINQNELCTIPLSRALQEVPEWLKRMLLSHDTEAEEDFASRGIEEKCYSQIVRGWLIKKNFWI